MIQMLSNFSYLKLTQGDVFASSFFCDLIGQMSEGLLRKRYQKQLDLNIDNQIKFIKIYFLKQYYDSNEAGFPRY